MWNVWTVVAIYLFISSLAFAEKPEKQDECDERLTVSGRHAIVRAKTANCKDGLRFTGCKTRMDKFFQMKLKSSCPLDDEEAYGDLIGCFKHEFRSRLFKTDIEQINDVENTPKHCVERCFVLGTELAAVIESSCMCGNEKDLQDLNNISLPLAKCFVKSCPGNEALSCGGNMAAALYTTGLHQRPVINPPHMTNLTYDGLKNWTNSKPEKQAKILYFLVLNGRASRQIRRMMNVLWSPNHYYYIHVDERQDFLYRELISMEKLAPNLKFKRNRFAPVWGGPVFLQMMLDAVRELFEDFPHWKWDFLVNLSETDFPLLNVEEYAEFLKDKKDKNFMRFDSRSTDDVMDGEVMEATYYECDDYVYNVGPRHWPKGVRASAGMNWMTLNRELLHFVTYDDSEIISGLKRYYNFSGLSVESFFHTVVLNTKFCTSVENNPLRYVAHKLGHDKCECQYDDFADLCACVPSVIQISDTFALEDEIARAGLFFLARKFDPIVNQVVLFAKEDGLMRFYTDHPSVKGWYKRLPNETVGLELNGIPPTLAYRQNIPGFHGYWQNLFHILDKSPKPSPVTISFMRSLSRISHKHILQHAMLQNSFFFFLGIVTKDPCVVADNWRLLPLEMTFHRELDQKARLLVLYRATCKNRFHSISINIETAFRRLGVRRRFFEKKKHRLDDFEIGTRFDRTELFFRNYAGAIGETDWPSLRLEFQNAGHRLPKQVNVTVHWIDPYNRTRGETIGKVNETGTVLNSVYPDNSERPLNDDPLLQHPPMYPPGLWTIRITEQLVHIITVNLSDTNISKTDPNDPDNVLNGQKDINDPSEQKDPSVQENDLINEENDLNDPKALEKDLKQENRTQTKEVTENRLLAELDFAVIPIAQESTAKLLKDSGIRKLKLWKLVEGIQEEFLESTETWQNSEKTSQHAQDLLTDSLLQMFYKPHAACFVTDALLGYEPPIENEQAENEPIGNEELISKQPMGSEQMKKEQPMNKEKRKQGNPKIQGAKCPPLNVRLYTMLQDCSGINFSSRLPDPKSQFNPNLKIDA